MKRILSYIVAAALFCLATGFPAVAEDLIVEDSVDSRFELVFEIEIVDSLSPELEWLLAEEALAVNGVEAPMGSDAIGPLEAPEPTERPEAVELPEAEPTEAPEVEPSELIIPAVGESEAQGDVTPAVPEDCRPWTWVRRQGRLWKTPPSPRHRPLVDVPAEDSAEDLTPILAEASIETPPPKAPTDELALAPVEAPVLSTSPGTEDESGDEPVEEPETTQSIPCFGRGFSHAKPSLFGNAKAA